MQNIIQVISCCCKVKTDMLFVSNYVFKLSTMSNCRSFHVMIQVYDNLCRQNIWCIWYIAYASFIRTLNGCCVHVLARALRCFEIKLIVKCKVIKVIYYVIYCYINTAVFYFNIFVCSLLWYRKGTRSFTNMPDLLNVSLLLTIEDYCYY
jgi:hypothetical protein